jgi:spermidine synthase
MTRWELLDTAPTPNGEGVLTLHRRNAELSIRIDGAELMNSRMHGSEEAMAGLACGGVGPRGRVLVGGLGMGFTLAATCAEVGPDVAITVCELSEAVVRWNGGVVGELAGHPLKDPRVRVEVGDVRDAIRGRWDVILLDVDNGPGGLTQESNGWLYGRQGLGKLHRALSGGGTLAVWSAHPDEAFTKRLRQAGFKPTAHSVRARANGKGPRHTIWVAST